MAEDGYLMDTGAARKSGRCPSAGRQPTLIMLAALAVLLSGAAALALTPAQLVGPDLHAQAVTVTGIRGDRLIYFDHQRRLRNEPVAQFVQLRNLGASISGPASGHDAAPAVEDPARGGLDLTDGQCFTGQFEPDPDGNVITWRTPQLGMVRVALERITRLNLTSNDNVQPDAGIIAADTVTLTNGDVVTGFISSVSGALVELTPDQGAEMTLPLDRIASLRLTNAPADPQRVDSRESLVTLTDGTRVRVLELELAGQQLTFHLPLAIQPDQRLSLPLEAVAAIDFTGSGWRLVELAGRAMSVTSGGEVFGVPMPPRVEAGRIFLHAPVRVSFEAPPQTQRLAADVHLDLDEAVPVDAMDWADVVVIVHGAGGGERRVHLRADEPVAALNVEVTGRTIDIELDPGINGPILDRVRLEDAVILQRLPVLETPDSTQ